MKKLSMFLSVLAVALAAGSVFAVEVKSSVWKDGYIFNGEECVKEVEAFCNGGNYACQLTLSSPQLRDIGTTQCGEVLTMSEPPVH